MTRRVGQKGFTIIELLIASTVFSVILLVCAAALIQIGRTYYKGVTASQTQEAARSIIEEISKTIQFNGGQVGAMIHPAATPSENPAAPSHICIGDKRYSFVVNRQLEPGSSVTADKSPHVLAVDSDGTCNTGLPLGDPDFLSGSNARELMSPRMRLTNLHIARNPDNGLYTVRVRVVSGDQEVFVDPDGAGPLPVACAPNKAGGQFCAVSELSTAVEKRVK